MLDVSKKEKKNRKEICDEKKFERKEKWKERKNTKQRMCMIWKKIEAYVRMKGKWAKKMIYAHIFWICSTSFIDSFWKPLIFSCWAYLPTTPLQPFERPHDSWIVCDLSSGDRVDKQDRKSVV